MTLHTGPVYRFKPYNVGRWVIWGGYALVIRWWRRCCGRAACR